MYMAINLKNWNQKSENLGGKILIYSKFPTASTSMQERPNLPRIGIIDLPNDESSWTYHAPNVPNDAPTFDWGCERVGKTNASKSYNWRLTSKRQLKPLTGS